MHFINPFKGLRPIKEKVSSIVIPSTDHLSKKLIDDYKKDNKWSYMNVFDPEIDNINSKKEKNIKSKKQFELMKKNSILLKDNAESFYIYKISSLNHTQVGIIGKTKISDYDNLHIRGHEEIYIERSQERTDQMLNLNAQIGPIYVIYPENNELEKLINNQTLKNPEYSFTALDQCEHTLWLINEKEITLQISEIFNRINCIYIADGHHRIDAMVKLSEFKKHQNINHTGDEPYNYVMVAAFSKNKARILDYNRLIKDLYGYSVKNFLKEVKKKFNIKEQNSSFRPHRSKTFGMFLDNTWYSLELKNEPQHNLFHINNLDINLLHYYLLEPILGIGDSRYDKRIDFIAGFHGLESIEKKVNSNEAKVGFSLFPTQIEDVIDFADKKLTMPPKSTWFDPKPLDGLVAYDFE
tara:strand:- start:89 stop:1318 length:1230 start_codon:yes stop_codon:yes gene_type:complete